MGRVKFPYKSVPESTSSKKKRRRNGKADPAETSTSDHSDDPQNPEARVRPSPPNASKHLRPDARIHRLHFRRYSALNPISLPKSTSRS